MPAESNKPRQTASATPVASGSTSAIIAATMARIRSLLPGQPEAVNLTCFGALLMCLALQVWRPFYFLHNDNVIGVYPAWVEFGRRLWSGRSPFVSDYLFGGFDLLRDPGALGVWNPLLWLASPLAITPARLAIVDVVATLNLLLCAFAFSHLLVQLSRNEDDATGTNRLSTGRIVFLSLSYTFSVWALVIGTNWLTFLGNQASLPILFLGLLHARRRTGIILVTCGLLHGLIAGHLNSFVFSLVFISFFLTVCAILERSAERLVRWAAAGAITLVLVGFPLFLAYGGFCGAAGDSSGL
ncbi:MAG TPA: hypothetical protein VF719_01470, partial [Abditibacteriaceae bacterium]